MAQQVAYDSRDDVVKISTGGGMLFWPWKHTAALDRQGTLDCSTAAFVHCPIDELLVLITPAVVIPAGLDFSFEEPCTERAGHHCFGSDLLAIFAARWMLTEVGALRTLHHVAFVATTACHGDDFIVKVHTGGHALSCGHAVTLLSDAEHGHRGNRQGQAGFFLQARDQVVRGENDASRGQPIQRKATVRSPCARSIAQAPRV